MPMVNPDGHHIVEAGGSSPYSQRKNAEQHQRLHHLAADRQHPVRHRPQPQLPLPVGLLRRLKRRALQPDLPRPRRQARTRNGGRAEQDPHAHPRPARAEQHRPGPAHHHRHLQEYALQRQPQPLSVGLDGQPHRPTTPTCANIGKHMSAPRQRRRATATSPASRPTASMPWTATPSTGPMANWAWPPTPPKLSGSSFFPPYSSGRRLSGPEQGHADLPGEDRPHALSDHARPRCNTVAVAPACRAAGHPGPPDRYYQLRLDGQRLYPERGRRRVLYGHAAVGGRHSTADDRRLHITYSGCVCQRRHHGSFCGTPYIFRSRSW